MAGKRQQPDHSDEGRPPMPFEDDLFGTSIPEEVSYDDIFSFGDSTQVTGDDLAGLPAGEPRSKRLLLTLKGLSRSQQILLAGIVAVTLVLVYTLARRTTPPEGAGSLKPPGDAHATQQAGVDLPSPSTPLSQQPVPEYAESALPSPEPLSLQLANRLHLRGDFENALITYDRLYRRLPPSDDNQPLRDFLLLRMALCSRNLGNANQADSLFRTVSLSRLPILRALARYHQSTTLLDRKRYLEAATKAYQTLALLEVIDYDEKWVSAVRQQCSFVVAEAMTRNVLALCDADAELPPELWGRHPDVDPFLEMDEAQVRVFVTSGVERLDEALLGPQIRRLAADGSTPRWSITCNGASVEELLARIAANAGLNVRWPEEGWAGPAEDSTRRKPVYLYLASASAQQAVATAAGSVGLLAQMDESRNVRVQDPASYSSLTDHTRLLTDESVSLWQRFLLAAENEQHVPTGHFALGLLQAVRGQVSEAIAEYKLVANRFPKHGLAPHALLHSGRLKVKLRDYVGAHGDLKQLVELYPETSLSDQACLSLADATMKARLYEEATGLYHKVYNLGLSVASQTESALGAGRCFHETGDHEEAAQWLNRYLALARDRNRPEYAGACLLLGKTYLALHRPREAHAALNAALKGELSRQQHVETIAVLVRAYIEQGLVLEALQALAGADGWQLSQLEMIELLLLRTQVLRSIGLTDKAIALLAERGQFLPGPELKGKVAVELAKCHLETGALEQARKTLTDVFPLVEAGPLAQEIGCTLAEVYLRLNQPSQAVSVCSQLLEYATGAAREPVSDLLATAYRKQGRYDIAVATLLEGYNPDGTDGTRPTPDISIGR